VNHTIEEDKPQPVEVIAHKGDHFTEEDFPLLPVDGPDKYLVAGDNFNSYTAESLLLKKIMESIYEYLDVNELKMSESFYLTIEDTERDVLTKNYFNKFGELISNNERFYFLKYNNGYILCPKNGALSFSTLSITIYSKSLDDVFKILDDFKELLKPILKKKDVPRLSINWQTTINGRNESFYKNEYLDDIFHPECYPYLDVVGLIKDYLSSEIPVIFMLGPPGTGKTRLIREILKQIYIKQKESVECIYTSSRDIIEEGTIYLSLIFSKTDVLVLEDIDYHVGARKDGNTSMYNLLSVSNGILSNSIKNKKIILSSNLPNINNIDEALLRPGRCFATIETKRLTPDQASIVFDKIEKKNVIEQKNYSLADIYNC